MKVWVIESGEYENRGVDGVAISTDAADRFIRARFPAPYIVTWNRVDDTTLVGEFEQVLGRSTRHQSTYDFTEYEVGD
jgi:hypothetical protein